MSESDSEDDKDYIPPAYDNESSSSDEDDDQPDSKRARVTSPKPSEEDEAKKKLIRESAWKSFQDTLATNSAVSRAEAPKKLVKIERRHLFAGEEVVEVVEVPEDSADAKKWPLWSPHDQNTQKEEQINTPSEFTSVSLSATSNSLSNGGSSVLPGIGLTASIPDTIQLSTTQSESSSTSPPANPMKRPGPRKSKTTLAPLPGSSKPKKITILAKSAMDWRSHVGSQPESELKDELEANRRGGGYLEKVEFLERVQERKEDMLEMNKGTKRRR